MNMKNASILQFLVITIPFLKQVREIKNNWKWWDTIRDDVSSDSVESYCTALTNCMVWRVSQLKYKQRVQY